MKRLMGVLAALVAIALMTGCAGAGHAAAPKEVTQALQDAVTCSDELVQRYQRFADGANGADKTAGQSAAEGAEEVDATSTVTDGTRTYESASSEIDATIARLQSDIDAVEQNSGTWGGREQAVAAMKNLTGALTYELDILKAQKTARDEAAGETGPKAALTVIVALDKAMQAITPPDCLKSYLQNTVASMPAIEASLAYAVAAPDSTLSKYTTNELLSWWMTKQSAYDAECDAIMVRQCKASGDLLRGIAAGAGEASKPTVDVSMIDEVAPNLYPSLDAAANIGITSYDSAHSVQVEAEIAGFSQKFEQRYDLAQGYNYLPIKPAVLPIKDLPDLANNTTTQLNVKVTDAQSGEVLAQESHPVERLSLYDFRWTNDEFGATAAFDIMAWLRPQADEVNAVNRKAADVLGGWTNGSAQVLPGYQAGNDPISTLLQVAAIQKAISDSGVTYVVDAYSFSSDQHILTPDAVVQKRQGLCIETSLLMASCLMSVGMHPLLIITPTHAQVAVETYANSGNYFLIETTVLPYEGLNASVGNKNDPAFYNGLLARDKTSNGVVYWTVNGTSAEWETYFKAMANSKLELGGNFVIDCNLQQVMGIQGLENLQQ